MPAMPWLSILTWPMTMGDLGAVRIDALVLGQEADAGKAEPVDLLALLGRDLALEPHEAALGREPIAQLRRIDLRS